MQIAWKRREMQLKFWLEHMKGIHHMEDSGVE